MIMYTFFENNADTLVGKNLNLLLLVFMILQPVSGILMSKHLYTFLPVLLISSQARSIHMLLAYWGYVLLCVHAGTHLVAPMKKLFMKSKKIFVAVCVAASCVSVYGCAAFIKRGFPGYMSGRTMFAFFDYSEPRVFFFLDYLAIMLLFMMVGRTFSRREQNINEFHQIVCNNWILPFVKIKKAAWVGARLLQNTLKAMGNG